VQKHEEKLTGAWRQRSTLRRRYEKWCKGDDIEDCTHKQRYEASYQSTVKVLQQNTWIDDRKFLKSCVQAGAEQNNINHPAHGTWAADFMLRQNESAAFLGKPTTSPGDICMSACKLHKHQQVSSGVSHLIKSVV